MHRYDLRISVYIYALSISVYMYALDSSVPLVMLSLSRPLPTCAGAYNIRLAPPTLGYPAYILENFHIQSPDPNIFTLPQFQLSATPLTVDMC